MDASKFTSIYSFLSILALAFACGQVRADIKPALYPITKVMCFETSTLQEELSSLFEGEEPCFARTGPSFGAAALDYINQVGIKISPLVATDLLLYRCSSTRHETVAANQALLIKGVPQGSFSSFDWDLTYQGKQVGEATYWTSEEKVHLWSLCSGSFASVCDLDNTGKQLRLVLKQTPTP